MKLDKKMFFDIFRNEFYVHVVYYKTQINNIYQVLKLIWIYNIWHTLLCTFQNLLDVKCYLEFLSSLVWIAINLSICSMWKGHTHVTYITQVAQRLFGLPFFQWKNFKLVHVMFRKEKLITHQINIHTLPFME